MTNGILKTVTVGDDTYIIRKFDARTGLKIARLIIAKATPLLPLLDADDDAKKTAARAKKMLEKTSNERLYEMIGKILETLDDTDIDNLVDKCLRVVSKQLPAGPQPVIDSTGNYGVEGIEYDLKLTLRLVYEAIIWGASDFFGENNLAGLLRQK